LFKPKRTPKGHRLYSDKDIQRIHQVLALLNKGISIGRVAKAIKENQVEPEPTNLLPFRQAKGELQRLTAEQRDEYSNTLLNIISDYDVLQLESFHHELFSLYSAESVSKNLILPVLETLNIRANQLQSLAGEYHFYRTFILNRVGGLFVKSLVQNNGKKILLMGLTHDHCDVKLLLFAMPLLRQGYKIINLGCNLSLEAVPMSISASDAEALLLYSDEQGLDGSQAKEFQTIINSLNKPVFIRGDFSAKQQSQLEESGLIRLPTESKNQAEIINKTFK